MVDADQSEVDSARMGAPPGSSLTDPQPCRPATEVTQASSDAPSHTAKDLSGSMPGSFPLPDHVQRPVDTEETPASVLEQTTRTELAHAMPQAKSESTVPRTAISYSENQDAGSGNGSIFKVIPNALSRIFGETADPEAGVTSGHTRISPRGQVHDSEPFPTHGARSRSRNTLGSSLWSAFSLDNVVDYVCNNPRTVLSLAALGALNVARGVWADGHAASSMSVPPPTGYAGHTGLYSELLHGIAPRSLSPFGPDWESVAMRSVGRAALKMANAAALSMASAGLGAQLVSTLSGYESYDEYRTQLGIARAKLEENLEKAESLGKSDVADPAESTAPTQETGEGTKGLDLEDVAIEEETKLD